MLSSKVPINKFKYLNYPMKSMVEYNWKLINSFSIPAGLVAGWIFITSLNVFIKYLIIIVILAVIGATVYNLSSSQKKPNASTSLAIVILMVIAFYLFRNIL